MRARQEGPLTAGDGWGGAGERRSRVNPRRCGVDRVSAAVERLGGGEVVFPSQRCACFLHGFLDRRDFGAGFGGGGVGELGGVGGVEPPVAVASAVVTSASRRSARLRAAARPVAAARAAFCACSRLSSA